MDAGGAMSETEISRSIELGRKAAAARSRSRALRAETLKVARQVAETERIVARTLATLAMQHPAHADRLQASSRAAAAHAALERQWHDRHIAAVAAGDSGGR